jgi:hypothetical protein
MHIHAYIYERKSERKKCQSSSNAQYRDFNIITDVQVINKFIKLSIRIEKMCTCESDLDLPCMK